MRKKSTPNDLLLYLYNETQLVETVLIQKDIDSDPETLAEFESLKKAGKLLDLLLERPSSRCFARIRDYAQRMARGKRVRPSDAWALA